MSCYPQNRCRDGGINGASVAALTIYDMCKAIDKDMVIEKTGLLEKQAENPGIGLERGLYSGFCFCFIFRLA